MRSKEVLIAAGADRRRRQIDAARSHNEVAFPAPSISPRLVRVSHNIYPNTAPAADSSTAAAMDNNLNAAYDACNSFNTKLKDTIMGLINANNDRKREIDGLRADHDQLRKDHNSFENSATRENDLR